MYYSTIYVGMDVHKKTFSLCRYTNEKEEEYYQKVTGHCSKVLNYLGTRKIKQQILSFLRVSYAISKSKWF